MNNKTMVSTVLSLGFIGFSACAPTGFTSVGDPSLTKKTDTPPATEQCVPDATDYNLAANVYSFAMTSSTGVSFGFSNGGGLIGAIGLGVKVKSGLLDLSMDIKKPLETEHQTVLGQSKLTNSDFNFAIDISVIKIGLGSASQTSISKLTSNGFDDLLKKTAATIAKDPNPWSTHINQVLDSQRVRVPVGSLAGIQYGDKFKVYKYKYTYNDESVGCSSGANGGYKLSLVPVATLVPLSIMSGSTILVPVGTPTVALSVNDLLEVGELYKAKKSDTRSLKKSVRLAKAAQSGRIIVEGAGDIDLTTYLNVQMPGMLNTSQFWLVGQ